MLGKFTSGTVRAFLPPWLNLHTLSAVIIAALMIYIGVQKISLLQCKLQNQKYSSQLQRLAEESKRKQVEVREVIKEGKTKIVTVRQEAEKIEKAPLEGDCKTPQIIMDADI